MEILDKNITAEVLFFFSHGLSLPWTLSVSLMQTLNMEGKRKNVYVFFSSCNEKADESVRISIAQKCEKLKFLFFLF